MFGFHLSELRIGAPCPFGPDGEPSAIDRRAAVTGAVRAGPMGLDGDAVGDTTNHGGPDKAIHAYPSDTLAAWADELPDRASRFAPGAFGENMVVAGVTEAEICLGDRWRLGGALLEVSQARQPCWKLNRRFDVPDMARRVQMTGRTGWYFRVIEPGEVRAGAAAALIARPNPAWPLARIGEILYHDTMNLPALRALADLHALPEGWRRLVTRRLARREVEDWSARLSGPGG